jgi:hypothetical protein
MKQSTNNEVVTYTVSLYIYNSGQWSWWSSNLFVELADYMAKANNNYSLMEQL